MLSKETCSDRNDEEEWLQTDRNETKGKMFNLLIKGSVGKEFVNNESIITKEVGKMLNLQNFDNQKLNQV